MNNKCSDDEPFMDAQSADAFEPDPMEALTGGNSSPQEEVIAPRSFFALADSEVRAESGAIVESSALLSKSGSARLSARITDSRITAPRLEPVPSVLRRPRTDVKPEPGEAADICANEPDTAVPLVCAKAPGATEATEATEATKATKATKATIVTPVTQIDMPSAAGKTEPLRKDPSHNCLPVLPSAQPVTFSRLPQPAKQSYSGLAYSVDKDLKWLDAGGSSSAPQDFVSAGKSPKPAGSISYPTFSKRLKKASLPVQSKFLALLALLRKLFLLHPRLATAGGTAIIFLIGFVQVQIVRENSELVQRGNVLLEHDRFGGAIACFDQALRTNPGMLNVRLARALAYEKSGDAKKALADYESVLRVSPEQPVALKHCALLLQNTGERAKSIQYYQKLVSSKRGDSLDLLNLATALAVDNQHARALICFDRFLKAHPGNSSVLAQRENSLLQVKRYDYAQAEHELMAVAAEDPVNRQEYVGRLAEIAGSLKRHNTAADLYSQLLTYNSANWQALAAYGWYSYLAGERALGLASLSRAVEQNPTAQAHYWRGTIYLNDKQYALARKEFEWTAGMLTTTRSEAPTSVAYMVPSANELKNKITFCRSEERLAQREGSKAETPGREISEAQLSARDWREIKAADSTILKANAYQALRDGRIQYAVAALTRAIKMSPDDSELRRYMTYALIKGNQASDALSQLGAWDELYAITDDDFVSVLTAMFESHQDESARKASTFALSRFSGDGTALLKISKVFFQYGCVPETRKVIAAGMKVASTEQKVRFAALQEGLEKEVASKVQPSDIPAPKS